MRSFVLMMALLSVRPLVASELPASLEDDPKVARDQFAFADGAEDDPKGMQAELFLASVQAPPATALAEASGAASASVVEVSKSAAKRPRYKWFGASLEVGVPDIISVSAVARPLHWLRLRFGLGTDLVNVGIHGGVTFVPLKYKVSPSVTIEGGKMFEGVANALVGQFGLKSNALKSFGFDYFNAHAGLEFGKPDRFYFYIHGGASYISMQIHGLQPTSGSDPSGTTCSDPHLKMWMPSGKLGFVVYL